MPLLVLLTPAAVMLGIIPRASSLVARIKSNKNYTSAIGQDLWLVGAHSTIDPTTWKPVLSLQNNAGHPTIVWTKVDATAIYHYHDAQVGQWSNVISMHG